MEFPHLKSRFASTGMPTERPKDSGSQPVVPTPDQAEASGPGLGPFPPALVRGRFARCVRLIDITLGHRRVAPRSSRRGVRKRLFPRGFGSLLASVITGRKGNARDAETRARAGAANPLSHTSTTAADWNARTAIARIIGRWDPTRSERELETASESHC